ncbi:MAG: DegT/DnrJ/EryC1/StrS family aminotransferase [Bdellovibrionota bacterium]
MDKIHLAGPSITALEIEYVNKAMNDWYDKPYYYCEKFQDEFAAYHERKHALLTTNCTSAIHLLLLGLGVGPGDEVIVPECTWIASAAPVTYCGAKTVFCDIDRDNWCIDHQKLESLITKKTKAVIMVGLFGNMPKIDEITAICKMHNIFLIEDAAESLGSKYKGKKAGTFGIASVFSFHRTKTLTTGEGGMLVLDDEELYHRCVILRDHGRGPKTKMYFNEAITPKYMPNNIQAALGYAQFHRLKELIDIKREIFFGFKNNLKDIPHLQFNEESEEVYNGVWITGLVFGNEHKITGAEVIERMAELNLPVRPFFYPLTSIPAYQKQVAGIDYKSLNPVAYDVSKRGVNLPCAMNLTAEQIKAVTDGLRKVLEK